MRHLWLLVGLLGLIVNGPVWAASYQMIDGTIVDPIQEYYGDPFPVDHSYSGPNLGPGVSLPGFSPSEGMILHSADLREADLQLARLGYTWL